MRADGYLPITSPTFTGDETTPAVFDAELIRGTGPSGTVVDGAGDPVAGADVLLAAKQRFVLIQNGRKGYTEPGGAATTDAAGRFTFQPVEGDYEVIVLHDRGVSRATAAQLAAGGTVTLRPWGRIEREVRVNSRPGANVGVSAYAREGRGDGPQMSFNYDATAGADGRFTLDRVVPGAVTVARRVPAGEGSWLIMHHTPVTATAGQTATVRVGGTGRPLVGRVVVPAAVVAEAWAHQVGRVTPAPPRPATVPVPADLSKLTEDERRAWTARAATAAAATFRRPVGRGGAQYSFMPAADGTFRVDDVPPGDYRVRASIGKPPANGGFSHGDALAEADVEVTVPDAPDGGVSDEPVDVGVVEVKPVVRGDARRPWLPMRAMPATVPTTAPAK